MKEINIDELRCLQLDILTYVDCFCAENKITYTIGYGTLLGAVRHKGYIPWDDDIDICMLREEYNKFIRLFPDNYKGRYSLLSIEKNPDWHIPFAKIYDSRTSATNIATKIREHGVSIDIFPIDDVPDNENEWQKFHKMILLLLRMKTIKGLKLGHIKGFLKKIHYLFFKVLLLPVPYKYLVLRIHKFAQTNNNKGRNRVFQCCAKSNEKKPLKKEIFHNIIDFSFEGRIFKGIADYNSFLSNAYGEYMKLPPIEKRYSHKTTNYYWND